MNDPLKEKVRELSLQVELAKHIMTPPQLVQWQKEVNEALKLRGVSLEENVQEPLNQLRMFV